MTATGYSVAAMGVKRLRSQVVGRLEERHSVSKLDGFARAMRKTSEFLSLHAAIFDVRIGRLCPRTTSRHFPRWAVDKLDVRFHG